MHVRSWLDAPHRTLMRAGVAGLLVALVGLGACTTAAPAVPDVTAAPPTASPIVVGAADTPTPTLAPTPAPEPTPSPEPQPSPTQPLVIGPLPTEPDGLAPPRDPYAMPPTAGPGGTPSPAGPTPAPGTVEPPPSTSTPPPGTAEWTGKPGKPATRLVISGLRIDLPVIKGDSRYPKCDVAQYMTSPFVSPGVAGPTYIYGHAQRGMLLPMLQASKRNNGAEMIGMRIDVYTSANARYVYEIFRVKRHATDFSLAFNLKAGEHRLVVQTSEGPSSAYPKLQVAARLLKVYQATTAQAQPTPKPRTCG